MLKKNKSSGIPALGPSVRYVPSERHQRSEGGGFDRGGGRGERECQRCKLRPSCSSEEWRRRPLTFCDDSMGTGGVSCCTLLKQGDGEVCLAEKKLQIITGATVAPASSPANCANVITVATKPLWRARGPIPPLRCLTSGLQPGLFPPRAGLSYWQLPGALRVWPVSTTTGAWEWPTV